MNTNPILNSVICENGHIFNPSITPNCPVCSAPVSANMVRCLKSGHPFIYGPTSKFCRICGSPSARQEAAQPAIPPVQTPPAPPPAPAQQPPASNNALPDSYNVSFSPDKAPDIYVPIFFPGGAPVPNSGSGLPVKPADDEPSSVRNENTGLPPLDGYNVVREDEPAAQTAPEAAPPLPDGCAALPSDEEQPAEAPDFTGLSPSSGCEEEPTERLISSFVPATPEENDSASPEENVSAAPDETALPLPEAEPESCAEEKTSGDEQTEYTTVPVHIPAENYCEKFVKVRNGRDYPASGWLVAISGSLYGESFELTAGINSVGGALTDRVFVYGDSAIGCETAFIITSVPGLDNVMVENAAGKQISVNGEPLTVPVQLKTGDTIAAGDTVFKIVLLDSGFYK